MNTEDWKNEAIAFLAIASLENSDYWRMYNLSKLGESYTYILKQKPYDENKSILNFEFTKKEWDFQKQNLWKKGQSIARQLAHNGIRLIFPEQEEFPEKLKTIPTPPKWLFVQGNTYNLSTKSVAIVGTRKPSEEGVFMTKVLMSGLCLKDIVTVSGLAVGIDHIVHMESIHYDIPTVAILGYGFDEEYPKGTQQTRDEILRNGGTIISEYLPWQKGSAQTFIRRNRLQAGLANSLIPVEWDIKSGTAHTVKFASEFNRKIYCIYLPRTKLIRPEIAYSENKYNAASYVLPNQISELLTAVQQDHNNEDNKQIPFKI
ncbi:DNA-protecting protein DprA [Cobetia sp. 29-18-1]|uniref:DNA-processing protein DprA n=1 Tax=Cobetia sp. 29-18-1 TaxID=3040018 RepID=UPI00244C3C5D|nr:DNA-protecting protein DprA [Cobetia sp. 29-18-1]MDH2299489.1 DNA-protecting protein DprA [Cobetia sp. 29-18-1]